MITTAIRRNSIHVCLISGQPLANLIPLLMELPPRVVFLVTAGMRIQAERLMKILRPRGVNAEQIEIRPYEFGQVSEVCQGIIDGNPGADLTLNVTGGTKVAAMAAFQTFYFADKRIIYLDTDDDRLLQLAPDETVTPITENLVKAKDYLAAYGLEMNSSGNPSADHSHRAAYLKELARFFVENEKLLGLFNGAIENAWNRKAGYVNIDLARLGDKAEELAALLRDCRVASRGAGVININGDNNCFFCQGGWFEEYVFRRLADLNSKNLRPLINVMVKWDEKGRATTDNEFDVVFTCRNRLFMISCKTARLDRDHGTPGKDAIYELDSLSDRAGGLFGRAMLASVRRLSDHDRRRAGRMGINVCDGDDILRIDDRLRAWIS